MQNFWNACFSFKCGEAEICRFSSSPLYNSSYHEDTSIYNPKLYNLVFRDILIDSAGQYFVLPVIDFAKQLIFDDLPSDDLDLPQPVKALQPKLMVMSGYRSL